MTISSSDFSSMLGPSLIILAIGIGVSCCDFHLHFLNDEWHWASFMHLFPIHTSSLEKCVIWTQVHFHTYFLHSVSYLFILLTMFLNDQKFLILINFIQFSNFSVKNCTYNFVSKNSSHDPRSNITQVSPPFPVLHYLTSLWASSQQTGGLAFWAQMGTWCWHPSP